MKKTARQCDSCGRQAIQDALPGGWITVYGAIGRAYRNPEDHWISQEFIGNRLRQHEFDFCSLECLDAALLKTRPCSPKED